MSKKDQTRSSSSGRGRRKKGKGKDRGGDTSGKKTKKQFDKSKVKCYSCQKLRHFAYECELPRRTILRENKRSRWPKQMKRKNHRC